MEKLNHYFLLYINPLLNSAIEFLRHLPQPNKQKV